jgi:hypothetical protein
VPAPNEVGDAYVELLIRSLTLSANGPLDLLLPAAPAGRPYLRSLVQRVLLQRKNARIALPFTFDPDADPAGRRTAYQLAPGIKTMIGRERLEQVRDCVLDVLDDDVPGDLIETGVWRGGTTILMRGILRARGVADRTVYVADSFAGLPPPDVDRYPADAGLDFHEHPVLAVGLEEVRANFARYDLLDDQVAFVEGWFRDTLPGLADRTFAVIRLDGDLYESTTDALVHLYPRLSPGGWLIVDDFHIPACVQAVTEYREAHGITAELHRVNWAAAWKKEAVRVPEPTPSGRREAG